MKIIEETIRRITISEVAGLDPIRVMLEDLGPGQGRINIECYGQSWANYWGAMGSETIAQFFSTCDEHYIATKLSGIMATVFDPDGLVSNARNEIIGERRKGDISKAEARERYEEAAQLEGIENESDAWANARYLTELFGDDWYRTMPTKPNPDYEYLLRIIRAVQEALKTIEPEKAAA